MAPMSNVKKHLFFASGGSHDLLLRVDHLALGIALSVVIFTCRFTVSGPSEGLHYVNKDAETH